MFRFFQLVMSGYFLAIHGGTYQPMIPSLPVGPASTTVFCSSMYFLTRSGWPQFSTIVSIEPLAMPCPADLFLHVGVGHVAAELGLGDVADDVGVGDVPGPRVDRDPEVPAVTLPRRVGVVLMPPPPQAARPRPTNRGDGDQPGTA